MGALCAGLMLPLLVLLPLLLLPLLPLLFRRLAV